MCLKHVAVAFVVGMQVDKADLCKLCVHRLPGGNTSSGSSSSSLDAVAASVKASLAVACKHAGAANEAAAVESAATEQQGSTGKQLLYLVFKHAGEANGVFAALPGKDGPQYIHRTAYNAVLTLCLCLCSGTYMHRRPEVLGIS